MPKRNSLIDRLQRFKNTWIANPAAQLEFVRLIEAVHQQPTHDHADHELLEWIDECRRGLRSIGIR